MNSSQPPQLRLEKVSLKTAIGAQYLLQDISFDVRQGDRVALVGPSGAGKSSLLRLMNRLNELSEGAIYLEGQEIRQVPVISLRQQVTLVLQESKLLGMTVRDALAYPLQLRGFNSQTIQQRIITWMDQLHLPSEWLDRTEVQLSVGQRQLVAIARALLIEPKILLLDEPTSALDAGRGSHLLNLLKSIAETQKTTLLLVNHQLDLVEQFCDRLLFLQQGKLVEDRPAHQVNWAELKQRLIDAETQEAQEWE